jgi:hypothetical protein
MNAAQIQCHGCKKNFTFTGYSQHVSRTRNAGCRAVHAQESSLFETCPTAASQPQVDSGLPPDALKDATRSPADPHHPPMRVIGHDTDPNVPTPRQPWTNGAVPSDLVMTRSTNLVLCFRWQPHRP